MSRLELPIFLAGFLSVLAFWVGLVLLVLLNRHERGGVIITYRSAKRLRAGAIAMLSIIGE